MKNNPTFVKVSTKGQIVIPKLIRKEMGIQSGSDLMLILQDRRITLTKFDQEMYSKIISLIKSK